MSIGMQEHNKMNGPSSSAFSREKIILLVINAMIVLNSYALGDAPKKKETAENGFNIVAGPQEKTFSEKYNQNIQLPMPEDAFLAILDHLQLKHELFGETGTNKVIPSMRWSNTIDVLKIQRCYQIYGNSRGEMYRAYVDKNRNVIYVENAFQYIGP